MRTVFTTLALVAALAVAGAAQAAQATTAKKDAAKPAATTKPAAAASHSVKSMDASSLVITKSGKAGGEMTFTLNADTKKDGAPAVGSPVSVRYRAEGSSNVATAVTAQAAKPAKTQAKK